MISCVGIFAARERPYSRTRFTLFMVGLAALAAIVLMGERRAIERKLITASTADGNAAVGVEATIVRFTQPLADTASDLRQVGLPWFLRRSGATATLYSTGAADIAVALTYRNKIVGTFTEKLEALGPDRSKLLVAFWPSDTEAVRQLASAIDTPLDPATLMRVVMAEHIRASINSDAFDMNVLTDMPGSRASVFRKAYRDSGLCQNPQVDDFQECPREREAANVRRAYRDEAAR